jgi:Mrp family chromosome partitioning ATPase
MSLAAAVALLLLASAILLLREFISGRAFRQIGYGVPYSPIRAAEPDSAAPAASIEQTPAALPRPMAQDERPAGSAPAPEGEPELPFEQEAPAAITASTETDHPPAAADALPRSVEVRGVAPVSVAVGPEERGEALANPPSSLDLDPDESGATELGEIVSSPAVRLALFVGAKGGEGAGEIAYAAARAAARNRVRCILIDVGAVPSTALGLERPGLGDLLAGEAAFGEAIRRDEDTAVHVIPLGARSGNVPLQRIRLVINALTHSYDKVVVVADGLEDWPDEYVRPDVAAIVCGPEITEQERADVYDDAIRRGARNALIVSYARDLEEKSAAA